MKVVRNSKSITIELNYEEARDLKEAVSWDDNYFTSKLSAQLHSELDELLGESNE